MTQGDMKSAIYDNSSRIDEIEGAVKELKERFERLERKLVEKEKTEKEKKDIGYYIKRVRRNRFGTELVATYLSEWDGDSDGGRVKFCDDVEKALELNPDEVSVIIKGLLNNAWYSHLKTGYNDEWSFEIIEA